MITPRRTRLVRVRDLRAFREAVLAAAVPGSIVIVPNIAAATLLRRLILSRASGDHLDDPPDLVTRDGLYDRLHARLSTPPPRLSPYERDVIAQAAAQEAATSIGPVPALHLRPALVAEMLRFYDQLRRQAQRVARFEELLVELLQQDAELDRGADRMLRQTRLLAATFRAYDRRVAGSGACDEHLLRERLLAEPSPSPVRNIVVTVPDWIADPDGLYLADFDLLTRLPGVETIDLVATDAILASGFHQRIHDWLPGVEEIQLGAGHAKGPPVLVVPGDPPPDSACFRNRDREEELIAVARRLLDERRVRAAEGAEPESLDRFAVVYKRPLPYLYVAREILGGAGIAYQTSDALPLAAEPCAAALDLVFEFVASSFTRDTLVALLRSPHFFFGEDARPIEREAVSALDRLLSAARYLGGFDRLENLAAVQLSDHPEVEVGAALRSGLQAAVELSDLQTPAPASTQIDRLLAFLSAHSEWRAERTGTSRDGPPSVAGSAGNGVEGDLRSRERRGRAAIVNTLERLAAASRAHGDAPLEINGLAASVRRWIEAETIDPDPTAHEMGLHLVDEQAARYGEFDDIVVVGLIEGEWSERTRRNIFYPSSLLRTLGWPSEKDWRAAAEARFLDLLGSPAERVWLSTITLDDEALVEPSSLLDEVSRTHLKWEPWVPPPTGRELFEDALSLDPVAIDRLEQETRGWAQLRLTRTAQADPAFHGQAGPPPPRIRSVSSVETYLQCPFKFFAQHVLRLEEEPDDEEVMDPRTQGKFVHQVFEAFFDRWQAGGHGAVVPENLEEARAVFEEVVENSLRGLVETEAALERTRLLGSPAAAGLGEAVLRMEAERPVGVVRRLLEHRLDGGFTFETADGPRVISLKGKADRVDLLADGTFRLIDYKLGWPPNRTRALQLPIYSLCAEQSLNGHLGRRWTIGEAAYIAFKGPRRVVPLFSSRDKDRVLRDAQERLVQAIDAIDRGEFPPRPDDVYRCETCAYDGVCRKDYVGDV